jgi:hypothetical protein
LLSSLYGTGLLLKLTPETISSKKKVFFLVLPPPFYIGLRIRDPRPRIRIWDEKILGSGSGIKHPGSATLIASVVVSGLC